MLNFSMINLVRRNGKKMDKGIRQEMVNFYKPFRYIPCFLQSPIERVRKKTKKLPVVIKFKPDNFTSGLHEVKNTKYKTLREFHSISCCSAKFSAEKIEHLIENCNHIEKIYYDRKVFSLLDTASSSVNADVLKDNGLTGEGSTIAVIDTGIHPHEDLEGRIIGFADFVKGQTNPYDDNGHGTHCAGDAAGNGALSDGQYQGPASEANLVGVKVLNKMGSGSLSTVIEGIDWCIQNQSKYNINILSLSLGSDATEPAEDDPVVNAVETAWDNGMVVCVAAGNSGPGEKTIGSPGISPKVITVGAADDSNTAERSDDSVAEFSSRGPTIDGLTKPDLLTPGVDIVSLRAPSSFIDKTNKSARVDGNYISLSGTSMATPICAGIVAQLLQSDSSLTPDQVKEKLMAACEDLGQSPNVQGAGYLNAANLLNQEEAKV
ncbi:MULTISPECIES: S8 family peptidase [Oceanobacillus]|uniref:Serine protease AprX n=1 Tax=Oceanobacillus kimchii TaxID=746691 RepID=A0ABQ5TKP6_9BACI|nr:MULTISPECIES: S8 family peptidase [Oceanobacillus]MBT2601176.1 S8 family peptidase [Oceanobacillus sp. ISL-74]MBT2652402.1 S8 family peptidase [Oceanobacillus sp. ISL-73]MCT1579066.1 S8 family peptidase [Oceanobacillus kimchii]MCT2137406.1 S8 family peptidase [Oceanobacillus kimchii]OEH54008.1 peptidase S8 [Oceanobacillus sp. E9]